MDYLKPELPEGHFDLEEIRGRALALIHLAQMKGVILTIDTFSRQPLAMGNIGMSPSVRLAASRSYRKEKKA